MTRVEILELDRREKETRLFSCAGGVQEHRLEMRSCSTTFQRYDSANVHRAPTYVLRCVSWAREEPENRGEMTSTVHYPALFFRLSTAEFWRFAWSSRHLPSRRYFAPSLMLRCLRLSPDGGCGASSVSVSSSGSRLSKDRVHQKSKSSPPAARFGCKLEPLGVERSMRVRVQVLHGEKRAGHVGVPSVWLLGVSVQV